MQGHLRIVWKVRDRAVDWELGKEMLVAESKRLSEGKTMASDR